jgi:hypothetical protein
MTKLNVTIDEISENRTMNVWEYIIFVSLPILVTAAVSIYVLDVFSEKSEPLKKEDVAKEAYESYLQRLNTLSQAYAKELETMKRAN